MISGIREAHADIVALRGPLPAGPLPAWDDPAWDDNVVEVTRAQAQVVVVRVLIEVWLREVQMRVQTERRIQHLRRIGRC